MNYTQKVGDMINVLAWISPGRDIRLCRHILWCLFKDTGRHIVLSHAVLVLVNKPPLIKLNYAGVG